MTVVTGIDRLAGDPSLVDSRVGLVTNDTGVLADLRQNVVALLESGVGLRALFGPEHGIGGTAQAGDSEPGGVDPASGLPVFDTYQRTEEQQDAQLRESGVDTLVYDLQDIGSRFYTYVWTMFDLMTSAARVGVRFVVADRPNPLGGAVSEGPLLEPEYASFVGRAAVPVRHGLTCAELAGWLNATAVPAAAGRPVDLGVLTMTGWRRDMRAEDTGLPWVPPSPNIPTADSARAYPGTCLFEGTNLSEGRGTTKPFELVGAPYVDRAYAAALTERRLPGVRFRHASFVPSFHKHAGVTVHGVQVYVTDETAFEPVRTALVMLRTARELYPDDFGWRVADSGAEQTAHRHFVDLLWGSDELRSTLDAGDDPEPLAPPPSPPEAWAGKETLLY